MSIKVLLRKQGIKIDGHFSDASQPPMDFIRVQSWSLQLFSLYKNSSYNNSKFNVIHHLYADDKQIYLELDYKKIFWLQYH